MSNRADLIDWVIEALRSNGGSATIIYVAKYIWEHHEMELRAAGDRFFTWQYDMRWAATSLRRRGRLVAAGDERRGVWTLTGK